MPLPSSNKTYWYRHCGYSYPTVAYARMLHQQVLEEAGGVHGIKDAGLLESALRTRCVLLESATCTHFLAAALEFFVKNQTFTEGNKRWFAVKADTKGRATTCNIVEVGSGDDNAHAGGRVY